MVDLRMDMAFDRSLPSLKVLLALGEFFDLVWQGGYEEARVLLDQTELLPIEEGELVTKIQELRVGRGVWADVLCERIGEVLLAAMELLTALHGNCRRGVGTSALSVMALRQRARLLVSFAGMMHDGPADISARLVRLEVLMS